MRKQPFSLPCSVLFTLLLNSAVYGQVLSWTRQVSAVSPPARSLSAMAYDATRAETLLFGGRTENSSDLADTWVWQYSNWVQKFPSVSPQPRYWHSLAFDGDRKEAVLFGGLFGPPFQDFPLGDTWIWDGSNWIQRQPTTSPSPRHGHVLVYDHARHQMLLYGSGSSPGNETWLWNGSTWIQAFPTRNPGPRSQHAMAFDAVRGEVVLFGGLDFEAPATRSDTWVWDGINWTQRFPSSNPGARFAHSLVYDSARGRVVLFGGKDTTGTNRNDTWIWDGDNWMQEFPANSPPQRTNHAMTYDPVSKASVLFGGLGSVVPLSLGDTWLLQEDVVVTWHKLSPATIPSPRALHALASDHVRKEVVLFGGLAKETNQSDETWVWNGFDWKRRFPTLVPPGRYSHAMAFDSARGEVVMWGGNTRTAGSQGNDTWIWDGDNWSPRSPAVSPPPLAKPEMVFDAVSGEILLYGIGQQGGGTTGRTWAWNGSNWLEKVTGTGPTSSGSHALVYDESRNEVLLLEGGQPAQTLVWNRALNTWGGRASATIPPERDSPVMTFDQNLDSCVLFGGSSKHPGLNDTWVWDGFKWAQIFPQRRPSERFWHRMAKDPVRRAALLFGGVAEGFSNDTWILAQTQAIGVPAISSVLPVTGLQGTDLSNFIVNGANFQTTAVLSFSGTGITVNSYVNRTATQIVANISIANNIPAGPRDVIVTNPDSQQAILAGGFQVVPLPPILLTLGPSGGTTNPQGSYAEPVSTATGNYYTSHTDLVIPGKGMPLHFTRYYNSQDTYQGPLGANWSHSYNIVLTEHGASGAVTIKEVDGHLIAFAPTSNGSYVAVTKGLLDTLTKNPGGSFTVQRKSQARFEFSSEGRLISKRDRNANTQTLSYDASGRLVSITDSSGRLLSLAYDSSNRITSLTDPLGRVLQYAYDLHGNLVSFRDALAGLSQYTYDAQHRMLTGTDPRGNVYLQNIYDAQGRVVLQKNARGFATTFQYNTPSAGITSITDPLGNIIKHVHDAQLRLTSVIDPAASVTSYAYSADNLKTMVTDPLGRNQTFSYDSSGNLTSATDPQGKTTALEYDSKNNLTRITDRLGRQTQFFYDAGGNLSSVLDAAGNSRAFTYNSAGQVLMARNPRSFTTSFSYDGIGNLTRVTDALGGVAELTYDAVGRLTSIRNQLGKTGTRAYDANNRLVSVTDPLGNATQFLYDPNGNLTRITDGNGRITQYAYDATNKLVQVTDAIGGITRYNHDANTDLVSITDANGHTSTLAYDEVRRLERMTDPLGRKKEYSYDAVGNITSTLDGNSKTNAFVYDSLNRLVQMSLSDGKSVAFDYDPVGNRLSMSDWRGTSQYAYDALNRVLSVTTPDGKIVGYGYDAVGNRSNLTYPDGKTVQHQYDALNRLTRVADWAGKATVYAYDAAGNLTGTTHPNGAAASYNYDSANRLLSVVNRSGTRTLSSFNYALDSVGNRLQMATLGGGVHRYGYDALYRLTSWTAPSNQVTQYNYDATGNRLSLISSAGTTQYTYDAADQLRSAGATAFTYDGNGNQLTKSASGATVHYAWDALNRLISVVGGGINTQYQYDGDGNRVGQQVGANAYQYLNDTIIPLPVVLNEMGPDGNIAYLYGLQMIAATSTAFQHYYQFDGLGSVANLTDPLGSLRANYAYDPWGKLLTPLDPLGGKSKYKFTGEPVDSGTGFLFLRARYYDPFIGRFLGKDKLAGSPAMPQSMNKYQYVLANPVRFGDPSGLVPSDQDVGSFSWALAQSAEISSWAKLLAFLGVETYGMPAVLDILKTATNPSLTTVEKAEVISLVSVLAVAKYFAAPAILGLAAVSPPGLFVLGAGLLALTAADHISPGSVNSAAVELFQTTNVITNTVIDAAISTLDTVTQGPVRFFTSLF